MPNTNSSTWPPNPNAINPNQTYQYEIYNYKNHKIQILYLSINLFKEYHLKAHYCYLANNFTISGSS